jgi:hypothetical protein
MNPSGSGCLCCVYFRGAAARVNRGRSRPWFGRCGKEMAAPGAAIRQVGNFDRRYFLKNFGVTRNSNGVASTLAPEPTR